MMRGKTFAALFILLILSEAVAMQPAWTCAANTLETDTGDASQVFQASESGVPAYVLRKPLISRLSFAVNVYNRNPLALHNTRLYLPLIRNETAHHFSLIKSISPAPTSFLNDTYGNVYAYWFMDSIDAEMEIYFSVDYLLMSFTTTFNAAADSVTAYDKASQVFTRYTMPEELIESDSTLIVAKALEIIAGETNPYKAAWLIYQFVRSYLAYEVQGEEKGALWALKNRKGDCSEFSYLFTALCRAAGIPARIQAGFAFHSQAEKVEYGHMWAEIYLENYGWFSVDPSWGYFGYMDGLHFTCIQSTPELTPYATFYAESKFLVQSDQQARISLEPLAAFDDFQFAKSVYDAVLEAGGAERTAKIAERLGGRVMLSSTCKRIDQLLATADFKIQKAIENWQTGSGDSLLLSSGARADAEEAAVLAQKMLFAIVIAVTAPVFLVVSLGCFIIYNRKQARQGMPGQSGG